MIPKGILRAATLMSLLILVSVSAWAAGGGGGDSEDVKPIAYKNAVKAIKAQNYKGGIELLKTYVVDYPRDADGFNYLGFAHRKLGDFDSALTYYKRALELNPDHLGAHEYLGEAYLEMNQPEEAKKHLAALDKLCFLPCKEYSDLKKDLAEFESKHK